MSDDVVYHSPRAIGSASTGCEPSQTRREQEAAGNPSACSTSSRRMQLQRRRDGGVHEVGAARRGLQLLPELHGTLVRVVRGGFLPCGQGLHSVSLHQLYLLGCVRR